MIKMFGFNKEEISLFRTLDNPRKIQEYLNSIPMNFEKEGETVFSPRMVLRQQRAHCIEGAMLTAVMLRFHGYKPLVVDLTSMKDDDDHVIAVFQRNGYWGAISKTNHAVLRYREPVYKTIHELVMSYFHEYFLNDSGQKTLRSYCEPVDWSCFDEKGWMISEEDVWYISKHLEKVPHINLLNRSQIAFLRKAEPIELEAGRIMEWKE